MPQAIGRRSLFSTCFLLLAADSSSAFYFPSFPPNSRFGDVFVSVKNIFFFFFKKHCFFRWRCGRSEARWSWCEIPLCVPSYITLHALVCFPSGGYKGGGERGRERGRGGGRIGYLLDSTVTMSLPQQFSKHIINTRLGARAFKY